MSVFVCVQVRGIVNRGHVRFEMLTIYPRGIKFTLAVKRGNKGAGNLQQDYCKDIKTWNNCRIRDIG